MRARRCTITSLLTCSSMVWNSCEAFALEFLLRLLLRVAAQIDALAQVIHAREMFLPVLVEHLQQEELLRRAHDFRAVLRFLLAEIAIDFVDHVVAHAVCASRSCWLFDPVLDFELHPNSDCSTSFEAGDVPLFVDAVGRHDGGARGR